MIFTTFTIFMVLATLNVQKTGMITLPKKWREKHPTNHMIAEETPEGLLIRPLEDIEYWEDDKGNFGLHFPRGMEMEQFLKTYKKALKTVESEEKRAQSAKKNRSRS